jgi:anthranilate phosphoribosyltransferase
MKIQDALAQLLDRQNLSSEQMAAVMRQVMTGEATPAQIGAFLTALRMKGETVDEVAAAAAVMRSLATRVTLAESSAVDIVGTGGDTTSTFNISTCSALVAAAAGIKIAKHGNRSVSSKSGAADLLEAAGVNLDITPAQVAECVATVGVGFMFAPRHHSAMKHAVGPRREMGVRTIFNLLGPLTNPAGAPNQLLGVYAREWVRPIADVLNKLGGGHVLVVHGENGMDELSVEGPSYVAELNNGDVSEYTVEPRQFGLDMHALSSIQVDGAEQSLALIHDVLDDTPGAARDIVLLNSGAAIYVGGAANSIKAGIDTARQALSSGAAAAMLAKLITVTQGFAHE